MCWWDDPSPAGRSGTLRARLYMAQEDAAPIRRAGVFLSGGAGYGASIESEAGFVFCSPNGYGSDVVIGGDTEIVGGATLSNSLAVGGDLTVGSNAARGGIAGGVPAEPAHRINGLRGLREVTRVTGGRWGE